MSLLDVSKLCVQRAARTTLDSVSLKIKTGEFVGLVGPNGAGKTTLMRALLGLVEHQGNSSLLQLDSVQRARRVAYLPQERDIAWPISVEQVVALGRLPYRRFGQGSSDKDRQLIEQLLQTFNLIALRKQPANQLSGGEKARVLIARALAQQTPLLMADEPIAGLDPANQIDCMQRFARHAADGHGVLASLHDLGLAARHCTRLIMLDKGRVVIDASPQEALQTQYVESVFGVHAFRSNGADGPIFQALSLVK